MIKSFTVTVSGKVQGVFFRASAKQKADELGVKGIVRNERNGDVYIEVEGDEEAVEDFLNWCKHGPPSAKVLGCQVKEKKSEGYSDFRIARF